MGNNGKVERIEKAFKYLQYKGLVQDKKDSRIVFSCVSITQ